MTLAASIGLGLLVSAWVLGSGALIALALEEWVLRDRLSWPRVLAAFGSVATGASIGIYLAAR